MTTKAIPVSGFFDELKRRKVYRVAVAYVIAAGGIIQLASAVFPAWELPNWALRLTIVLLLVGFPLALILAWAFDVTPQGIQATPTMPLNHGLEFAHRHRRRNVTLLVGSGVLVSALAGFFLLPRADAKMEKSVAVLPFENFSDKPENAYFADGIQDDILTNLSKIGDLKVISRTSVMAYRGKQKSVRQIGKELGVGAILEGSVRREANRVRVNVQLINAQNDEHIWAEDYDRDLTDVFAIQTDLAQKIAHELQAQLSPSEKAGMIRKPTENGEAYLAFVQAHDLQSAALEDRAKSNQAVQLYQRAIQLDPNFALAIANLSITHSWIFHNFDPKDEQRILAAKYAERAIQLAPEMPEAHLAQGFVLYYGERDYKGALQEFAIAQRGLPNDSQIYLVIGAIQRRQGEWEQSTANLEKAVSLNPNDTWPLQNLFFNYQMERKFEAANRVVDRALAINPRSFSFWAFKATLAFAERGDLTVAEKSLQRLDQEIASGQMKELDPETRADVALGKGGLFLCRGEAQKAVETLRQVPPEVFAAKPSGFVEALLLEGSAYQKLGQTVEAQSALMRAKDLAESAVREAPNEASRHSHLARVLARLGEKEAAIMEAKRATELLPVSLDAFEGPRLVEGLAEVYALTGERAQAIELLDGLLSRPSDLTVPILKFDPRWESLLADPAFEQLLAKHASRS
jgi:TolB-like protein/Flp pilus assembly protein TadD